MNERGNLVCHEILTLDQLATAITEYLQKYRNVKYPIKVTVDFTVNNNKSLEVKLYENE